jgi:uncharacterized HAD superfamily protein
MKKQPKIFLIDVDGTLCEETCYTPEECLVATPIQKTIDRVNKKFLTEFIIIYTARREHLIGNTIKWLRKVGVDYHAISNHKIPGDEYWDNKAVDPNKL